MNIKIVEKTAHELQDYQISPENNYKRLEEDNYYYMWYVASLGETFTYWDEERFGVVPALTISLQ